MSSVRNRNGFGGCKTSISWSKAGSTNLAHSNNLVQTCGIETFLKPQFSVAALCLLFDLYRFHCSYMSLHFRTQDTAHAAEYTNSVINVLLGFPFPFSGSSSFSYIRHLLLLYFDRPFLHRPSSPHGVCCFHHAKAWYRAIKATWHCAAFFR